MSGLSTAASDISFQPGFSCGDDSDTGPSDGEYAGVELFNLGQEKREYASFELRLNTLDQFH